MPDMIPLTTLSQPHEDVLYVNLQAPVEHLMGTAERRLESLSVLLRLLEDSADEMPMPAGVARLSASLAPLLEEARQLYDLAERKARQEQAGT
ncbi:hypothetical protein [Pseudomonas delhiensis]|uniref:hypothetical protein n=1 Tax=Pseudomonas delhiensis TaxID=366289 RepID=UPI00315A5360